MAVNPLLKDVTRLSGIAVKTERGAAFNTAQDGNTVTLGKHQTSLHGISGQDEINIGLNIDYVKQILTAFKDTGASGVFINFNDTSNPVRITSDHTPTALSVIMPTRL